MQIPGMRLVGTRAEVWIGDNPSGRFHDHPTEDAKLRFALLFNNYFVHSSVMMRKAALDEVGSYTTDRSRQPPEDYELWSRIARRFSVANLPERLTIYREVPASMSRDGIDPFKEKLVLISAENLSAASTGEVKPQRIHLDIAILCMECRKKCRKTQKLKRCALSFLTPVPQFSGCSSSTANRIQLRVGTRLCDIISGFTNSGCVLVELRGRH